MTMITIDKDIAIEEQLLDDARSTLRELMEAIKTTRGQVSRGEFKDALGECPDVRKLTSFYMTCVETENRLGKCREQKAGIAQCGVAFDLDAARSSIGSKLDSLRSAHSAE